MKQESKQIKDCSNSELQYYIKWSKKEVKQYLEFEKMIVKELERRRKDPNWKKKLIMSKHANN